MDSSLASLTSWRLRDAGIEFAVADNGDLGIAGPNIALGSMIISFEDDEVSVFLGDVTHCHFTPCAPQDDFPGRTPEQVASLAVEFISEVVADEWVIWRWSNGRDGCYKPDGDDEESANAPLSGEDVEYHLWSGPLVPPDKPLARTRER